MVVVVELKGRQRTRRWFSPWRLLLSTVLLLVTTGFLLLLRFRGYRRAGTIATTVVITRKDLEDDDHHRRCEALLDRFQGSFGERRRYRSERVRLFLEKLAVKEEEYRRQQKVEKAAAIARRDPAKKPSINKKDSKKKDGAPPPKKMWFLWDVEASCHTDIRGFLEENFPSETNELYDTFYSGPKMLCGIDLLSSSVSRTSAGGEREKKDPPPPPPDPAKQQRPRQRRKLFDIFRRGFQKKKKNDERCLAYKIGHGNKSLDATVETFLGCETHVFSSKKVRYDPKNVAIPKYPSSWIHHKNRDVFSSTTIPKAMLELGHAGRTIDVLSIDCGGCEWDVLPKLLDLVIAGSVRINQIHAEMHDDRFDGTAEGSNPHVIDFFEKIDQAEMRALEKEPDFGDRTYQYTWVSEDFLREANRNSLCA
eukprot:CAMPEP_0197176454 /NCGR_PEP_ID=MMETSP1423-20130617/2380_1 /TAXON_ID=476441 /ORGANISM="Pseudo-nitzschia heimii, Strain UNC1101" /LENGTH=421 /DNA_ID=CAMNT_0042625835 /DNA_START=351 /DNA_END=1616 /DNA_ORIENTATION=-